MFLLMNRNKVTKLDESAIRILTSLEDFEMNTIAEMINEIYDRNEIWEDLHRAAKEIRGKTNLMSHMTNN